MGEREGVYQVVLAIVQYPHRCRHHDNAPFVSTTQTCRFTCVLIERPEPNGQCQVACEQYVEHERVSRGDGEIWCTIAEGLELR